MARPAPGADRSVAVLELLAAHPEERFTLSEVARRCDLNKATAHALLSALSERGVLLRHPAEKRYSLGPRLITIGEAARHGYTAADFVHPVVEQLATATGRWARAWRARGDQLVCVAQSGAPDAAGAIPTGSRAFGIPVSVPLVPPVGTALMAWGDAPSREAWLARAAAVEAVRSALDALPAIREQGFAVTLASGELRALTGRVRQGADGSGDGAGRRTPLVDHAARRRALLLAVARQSLLVTEIDDAAGYVVADVSAPVFGATGDVVLTLSVTTVADDALPGRDVRALGQWVAAAADALTASSRGRRPVASRRDVT
jgi:DNA-binding IclR family transcriptional regulator